MYGGVRRQRGVAVQHHGRALPPQLMEQLFLHSAHGMESGDDHLFAVQRLAGGLAVLRHKKRIAGGSGPAAFQEQGVVGLPDVSQLFQKPGGKVLHVLFGVEDVFRGDALPGAFLVKRFQAQPPGDEQRGVVQRQTRQGRAILLRQGAYALHERFHTVQAPRNVMRRVRQGSVFQTDAQTREELRRCRHFRGAAGFRQLRVEKETAAQISGGAVVRENAEEITQVSGGRGGGVNGMHKPCQGCERVAIPGYYMYGTHGQFSTGVMRWRSGYTRRPRGEWPSLRGKACSSCR